MFKRLLVPLDGSSLAETVLPAAAFLAEILASTVMLIHIIERNAPSEIHSERHLTNPEEAEAYLKNIAQSAFPKNIQVETHVHTTEVSDVARSIVDHSEELEPDLVILCTHGRGGLRDLIYGSIAQQVIGMGRTPVLLIQPKGEKEDEVFQCHKIIVPLDGSQEHEQGLPIAIQLTQACQGALHLLMVVPTMKTLTAEQAATGRLLPGTTTAMLDMVEQRGAEYLLNRLKQLENSGIELTAEVERGDPATLIVETALKSQADMIVIGTHGKTGMDAFWAGSVTPKISSHSKIPLLLVPVMVKPDKD